MGCQVDNRASPTYSGPHRGRVNKNTCQSRTERVQAWICHVECNNYYVPEALRFVAVKLLALQIRILYIGSERIASDKTCCSQTIRTCICLWKVNIGQAA